VETEGDVVIGERSMTNSLGLVNWSSSKFAETYQRTNLVALLQGLAAQFGVFDDGSAKCMVVLAQRSTSSTSNLIRASSMAGSAANISGRSMKTWAPAVMV